PAILNQNVGGRKLDSRTKKVVSVPLKIRQDRSQSQRSTLQLQTVLDDIFGASFMRVMQAHLSERRNELGEGAASHELLNFSWSDIQEILSEFENNVRQRLAMLQMNAWRIRGLITSIRYLFESLEKSENKEAVILRNYHESIYNVLEEIEIQFSKSNVEECMGSFQSARKELEMFLSRFEDLVVSYREKLPVRATQIEIMAAKKYIEIQMGVENLVLVGQGSEGIVFTDGSRAFKYFHHGSDHFGSDQLDFLSEKLKPGNCLNHITPIMNLSISGKRVVLVSKLVTGSVYEGGYLNDLLDLLRECKSAGICLTNIAPENLLVGETGLTFIDLGIGIVRFSDDCFYQMCKRAYLTYRWHFRKDLKDLLSRALRENNMPELFGFDQFIEALKVQDHHELLDPYVVSLVQEAGASEVLDYGCGTGIISGKLARIGKTVVSFDVDPTRFEARNPHPPGVRFVDRVGLDKMISDGKRFDCIVCNLVICTLEQDDAALQVLRECRNLVSDHGKLILGFCNPYDISTAESTTHIKELPAEADVRTRFVYRKKSKKTGRWREDVHRSPAWYEFAIREAGFNRDSLIEIPSVDVQRLSPSSDFMQLTLSPATLEPADVSLLIKASAMEWRTVRKQVQHLVRQLEVPRRFLEKIVVTDKNETSFSRQYDTGDWKKFQAELDLLVEDRVIDRYIVVPDSKDSISQISEMWFGLQSSNLKSRNGQPTLTTLYGFHECKGEYILQVDSDCMIGRRRKDHDYFEELLALFSKDENALTVSLPIADDSDRNFTTHNANGKWRVEVRCSLISRNRLLKLTPLPNTLDVDSVLKTPWHRSVDLAIANSNLQSYRGGSQDIFFVHVPNDLKKDFNSWYNVMKAIEAGNLDRSQFGNVDLAGPMEAWLEQRTEKIAFIMRGRNIPISKIRRSVRSLLAQEEQGWGVVFIDAASSNGQEEYLEEVVSRELKGRSTLYRNILPAAPIENIYIAIRKLCKNPDSIIVLLDLDDALIGKGVIKTLNDAYDGGADATVGSMLRTDKYAEYPVDFRNPRTSRGGNVWQHLRTFRKYLFDQIRLEDFQVDGEWVPYAEDWAIMLPIVELSKNPFHLTTPVYFYEPSSKNYSIGDRESIIGKIVNKRSYKVS
ncbi:MAG: glycosyltransferase, partial [Candidatus Thermoplasmatota archaeon]|nr:glycosyltransferase [Candidatus Thermoplasmatota archaeon]